MDRFEPYGLSHQVVVGLLVVGAVVLVGTGRSLRGSDAESRWGKGFAVAILACTLPLQAVSFARFDGELVEVLPLQLCDVASLVAPYALWTHRRWAVAATYFWGLTLTTQAVATPDLASGFPDPVFLTFWGMHLLVVWAACYLTWGLGLGPGWRDYASTVVVTAGWAVCVFGFNTAVGTNYGYLNAKPNAPSILDLLGDWPAYLVAEVVIVLAVWALLTWPWVVAARRRVSPNTPPVPHGRRRRPAGR